MPTASRRLIEHPAAAAFIAQVRDPQALAGFVIGQIAADEAEILSIGVAPEWQRRGIGRQMVEGLCARPRGAPRSSACSSRSPPTTPPPSASTRASGFKVVGARKAYYQRAGGPAVDALILSPRPLVGAAGAARWTARDRPHIKP